MLPPDTIARKAELDGIKQILLAERLGKELDGAALHRLHRHRDISVGCDEDDWEFPLSGGELALEIKTASPRQSHIQHQARRAIGRLGLEKIGNGRKHLRLKAERAQQTFDRGSKLRIVVNDPDGRRFVRHRLYSRSKIAGIALVSIAASVCSVAAICRQEQPRSPALAHTRIHQRLRALTLAR